MVQRTSGAAPAQRHLLEVKDVCVEFETKSGPSKPVDGVSFYVDDGECLGIVGESGCGKSVTAMAILRLLPSTGRIASGSVQLQGQELTKLSEGEMRSLRGRRISMIMQDPMTSLNPVFTIGYQVGEGVSTHQGLRGKKLLDRVIEMLKLVNIPAAANRVGDYPDQFSGGMRQRIAGAIGLSTTPDVLICDEPTTALDVTIQAQYLELLKDVQEQTGVALIFITHDMGIVARMCDRVAVMYAGRVVETGATRDVFRNPSHPYTIALLKCLPRLEGVDHLESIEGQPPDARAMPTGCRFAPRCPKAQDTCRESYPETQGISQGHEVACFFPGGWE